MSLNFSMVIKADVDQARTQLRGLQGEVTKTGAEAKVLGKETKAAGDAIDLMGDKARAAAAAADAMADADRNAAAAAETTAAATRQAATESERLAGKNRLAAGSVGNLVAQFNDIGVMMAAGQNPLQLALQQGTQITQAFGDKGASAAVEDVGAALLSMLSPLNLVTIGAIAAGTAMFQWLTSSEQSARATIDVLSDLDKVTQQIRKSSVDSAKAALEAYGKLDAGVVHLEGSLRRIETVKAFQIQLEAVRALKSETEGSWFAAFTDSRFTQGGQIADILGTDWLQKGMLKATDAVTNFRNTLNDLDKAKGPQAQIRVFRELQNQMVAATGGIDQMTIRQLAFYQSLVQSEQQTRKLVEAQNEAARAQLELSRAANTENARMGGPTSIDVPVNRTLDDVSMHSEAANGAISRLIGLVSDLNSELKSASSGDLSGVFSRAMPAANALYARAVAIGGVMLRKAQQAAAVGGGRGVGSQGPDLDPYGFRAQLASQNQPASNSGTSGVTGTGSGAGAAKAESSAIAELIARMREENDVARETDPVKQELLKHRKDLATATAAERSEVESLIRASQQLKAVQAVEDFASQSIMSALDMIGQSGTKAIDVLKALVSQLAKVAVQALITGQGPLAGILGINGGIFSGLFGGGGGGGTGSLGLPKPFANGGLITGEGGAREDKITIRASAGETIMNGRASRRWRPVLERMNAGSDLPGFATGGVIGGSMAGSGSGGSRGGDIVQNITINNPTGNSEIREMVKQGLTEGMKSYDRNVLPGRIKSIFSEGAKVTG